MEKLTANAAREEILKEIEGLVAAAGYISNPLPAYTLAEAWSRLYEELKSRYSPEARKSPMPVATYDKPLTTNQRKLLDYIIGAVEEDGVFPTYETMKAYMGYSSGNSITQHLKRLQSKGYLVKDAERGWLAFDRDENRCPYCKQKYQNR